MIQYYIGEDAIWKLCATHPYEQNNAAGVALYYSPVNLAANQEMAHFFLNRISSEKVKCVEVDDKTGAYKRIVVENAFGSLSEVRFINTFIS